MTTHRRAILALLLLLFPCGTALGSDEDRETLELFYDSASTASSATRKPVPVSQIAENLTVVTAEAIRAINAHTAADVLRHVPGVQIDDIRSPGSLTSYGVQGASFRHVMVLLDGISFSNLSDNFADLGAVPADIIERVEIIKGSGSSSWGSALGGVINIILKRPPTEEEHTTEIAASAGQRSTSALRGETAGTGK
ncbi:MAG TPA: TonB-dependent receptor plug domain-containing protein, partial [Verrucomicrobiae bacterium]|nr:TonB-dependent receptor plug domain-containing protein [Verrucomicrobiae bacterium]